MKTLIDDSVDIERIDSIKYHLVAWKRKMSNAKHRPRYLFFDRFAKHPSDSFMHKVMAVMQMFEIINCQKILDKNIIINIIMKNKRRIYDREEKRREEKRREEKRREEKR